MGLLDKIKDLFIDEIVEDEEVELEEENKEKYEEPKDVLPKVMRETIAKDEEKKKKVDFDFNLEPEKPKEEQPKKETKSFSFPIDFEDDFVPKRRSNVNVLEAEKQAAIEKEREQKIKEQRLREQKAKEEIVKPKTSSLYPPKEKVVEKPKFKASPVISPVYGILDKNYRKEEVVEKEEAQTTMQRPSKKVDFETVRKKAFGNLTDELKDNLMCENCELYKEVKRISSLKEDDLLYEMTVDEEPEVTIKTAYENYEEFGVAYQPEEHKRQTPVVEEKKEDIEDVIVNHNEEEQTAEKIEIQEPVEKEVLPSREEKNKNIVKEQEEKVDADFFELIDSMYKERVDE